MDFEEFCFRIYSDFSVQDVREEAHSESFELLKVEAEDFKSARFGALVYADKLEREALKDAACELEINHGI